MARIKLKFEYIKNLADNEINKNNVLKNDNNKILNKIIDDIYSLQKNENYFNNFTVNDDTTFIKSYKLKIEDLIKEEFNQYDISETYNDILKSLAAFVKTKEFAKFRYSGIVITGFGEDEIFPTLVEYYIDDIIDNKLRYYKKDEYELSKSRNARLFPFAQSEMIYTFAIGIHPELRKSIEEVLNKLIEKYNEELKNIPEIDKMLINKEDIINKLTTMNKSIYKDFITEINRQSNDLHISPLMDAIGELPKEELAMMAESLVNLTYLKKRYSTEVETVGGAIDVAVITKGDGFIWIKRKHYFDKEINPQYLNKYK